MAIRPLSTRMNVNAIRAVSNGYAVSHDLMNYARKQCKNIEISFGNLREGWNKNT